MRIIVDMQARLVAQVFAQKLAIPKLLDMQVMPCWIDTQDYIEELARLVLRTPQSCEPGIWCLDVLSLNTTDKKESPPSKENLPLFHVLLTLSLALIVVCRFLRSRKVGKRQS